MVQSPATATATATATASSRRRPRSSTPETPCYLRLPSLVLVVLSLSMIDLSNSFGLVIPSKRGAGLNRASSLPTTSTFTSTDGSTSLLSPLLSSSSSLSPRRNIAGTSHKSPSALNVWWFGGDQSESQNGGDDDSCELVAVRIERPTSNSRKIYGELSVPGVSIDDVWSILTDYNRLSIHVPNLKESRIVRENRSRNYRSGGEKSVPGDGSYKCQLYQVGAQKIIGFDFSASVTMDMTEQFVAASTSNARMIGFKCVDSQFFTTFDGAWTIQEQRNAVTGEKEVLCSYDVLVKPKGPVPVAALEWRIREDVPTNLRAVKAATLGMVGGVSSQPPSPSSRELVSVSAAAASSSSPLSSRNNSNNNNNGRRNGRPARRNGTSQLQNSGGPRSPMRMGAKTASRLAAVMVDWERGETMAKYLE